MKKNSFYLIVIAVLIITGCMHKETQINLNADGSGTVDLKLTMTKQMINFFNETDEDLDNDKINPFNKTEFIKNEPEMGKNIKLIAYNEINNSKIMGGAGTYSFTDINDLTLSVIPKTDFEEINEKLKINFKFEKNDSFSSLTIIPPDVLRLKGENSLHEEKIQNGIDTFSSFLEELYIKFSININGKIIYTNAANRINNECIIADLDVKEILKNSDELIKLITSDNTADIKTKINAIKGLKIETEKEIKIEFKQK